MQNKKPLWSALHAQTWQQDSALNYEAKPDNKVLSDFTCGECSKGLNCNINDVSILDKQIIITRAAPIERNSPDHGTVRDKRVAEPTCVDKLIVAPTAEKIKSIIMMKSIQ